MYVNEWLHCFCLYWTMHTQRKDENCVLASSSYIRAAMPNLRRFFSFLKHSNTIQHQNEKRTKKKWNRFVLSYAHSGSQMFGRPFFFLFVLAISSVVVTRAVSIIIFLLFVRVCSAQHDSEMRAVGWLCAQWKWTLCALDTVIRKNTQLPISTRNEKCHPTNIDYDRILDLKKAPYLHKNPYAPAVYDQQKIYSYSLFVSHILVVFHRGIRNRATRINANIDRKMRLLHIFFFVCWNT